jgi:HAD superfamily hydrolase (TIGR01549 family)
VSIRAVLLDFGGTLDSEGRHWSTQFADSFAACGLCVQRGALDQAFLASDRALALDPAAGGLGFSAYVEQQIRTMLDLLALDARHALPVAEHFLASARSHVARNCVLLSRHRDRFRYALVSNFTSNLPLILQELGISKVFDAVLCSAIEGTKKPEPAIFLRALAALQTEPGQAAMIGDSLGNDIVPAKRLGLRAVWLRGDANFSKEREDAADHVVGNFADALGVCLDQTEGSPS